MPQAQKHCHASNLIAQHQTQTTNRHLQNLCVTQPVHQCRRKNHTSETSSTVLRGGCKNVHQPCLHGCAVVGAAPCDATRLARGRAVWEAPGFFFLYAVDHLLLSCGNITYTSYTSAVTPLHTSCCSTVQRGLTAQPHQAAAANTSFGALQHQHMAIVHRRQIQLHYLSKHDLQSVVLQHSGGAHIPSSAEAQLPTNLHTLSVSHYTLQVHTCCM